MFKTSLWDKSNTINKLNYIVKKFNIIINNNNATAINPTTLNTSKKKIETRQHKTNLKINPTTKINPKT